VTCPAGSPPAGKREKEVLNVTKRRKSVIDEEKVRQQLITGIPNKAVYDEKLPTNVRLERNLKERALAEAEERRTTLSEVLNDALRSYFGLD
jgi:hypothetical protein